MPVTIDSLGNSYDTEQLPKYSTPTPAERQTAAAYLAYQRAEPPGYPTDNRWKQVQHLDGIIYVAIRAIRNLASGATYQVLRKSKDDNDRTTFGPGNTIGKSLASSQMTGQDEEYIPFADEDHPLCHLIARPNPTETFGELAAKLVMQNRLTGVGPLWAVPNEKHKPVELWSLKTPALYPLRQISQQYPRGAWRVQPYYTYGFTAMPSGMTASGAVIPGEEVKRWMEPHPYLDWDGYSPLTAGAKQLDVLTSIDEARKTAMDDGIVLDTYIVLPGADQATLDAKMAEMKAMGLGSKKHRAFRAFGTNSPDSKATIQTVNARVVDMDFPQGWEQMVKFCLALFGVPPSVAGLNAAGSYSEHYAARQQFVDEQADYLESLGTFLTKSLAWPWCGYPGEFLIRVKPRPINDHELAEKKHSRQCQVGTITLDESRKKDDLPAWEDPEIGKLPVQVALAVIQQNAQPQPQPGMPGQEQPGMDGAPPDAGADQGEEQPTDAAGLQDAITNEALATLGVPGDDQTEQPESAPAPAPMQKAFGGARGRFDESKHKRDHGKFSSTGGAGASTPANPMRGGARGGAGRPKSPPLPAGKGPGDYYGTHPGAKPPPLPPQEPLTDKQELDGLAEQLKNGDSSVNLLDPKGRVHTIRNGNDVAAFVRAGGRIPANLGDSPARSGPKPPPIPGPKPPPLPPPKSAGEHKERIKASAPKIANMAGQIPDGADVLASAPRWAAKAADKHAGAVAAYLGISPEEAHHLIRSTIEHLCHVAANINSSGASQKTVRGASGKQLKFRIGGAGKQTQSGATKTNNRGGGGAVPRPKNPMGKGSRPPLPSGAVKSMIAMNELEGSAGGFLVPPSCAPKVKRRKYRRMLRKALRELEG